ncbi:MAG: ABC transporter ATP-binding protein [Candidatus Coatesbacteria bacterium]
MTAGIVVESLTKTYRGGKVRALDGVSLEIRPGEVFGVIGPNGAGKTTLMGCMLGLLRPDSGTVAVDGRSPDDLGVHAITGYLPERLMFDRWMSGRDFLRYHHALALQPDAARDGEVAGLLEQVGLTAEDAAKKVKAYSRGMLQRLGLAQALVARPRYLYLDEPTSGMDPVGAIMARRIVDDLARRGTTVVINSHQLEQVERLCTRVAFVKDGRVESVEVPAAGASAARVLLIRTAAPVPAGVDPGRVVAAAGGSLAGSTETSLRVEVPDDEAAAKVLAALVGAGVRIIEAVPETGRLERLFLEGPGGAA